jgi:electron transport complex protein RnfE
LVWLVIPDYPGFLLAILPPGAFIGLGLLIAGRNWVEQRRAAAQTVPPLVPSPSH